MAAAARYAELHCRSNFTFLEGGSHPEELVDRALTLGLEAVALTDRDGLYGAVRFAKAAKNTKLRAILGVELTVEVPELRPKKRRDLTPHERAAQPRIVLLAENETGYANVARAISAAQLRGRKRDARLRLSDLAGKAEGIIALSGSAHGWAEEALLRGDVATARERTAELRDIFGGRYYAELQHHLRPEDARLILAQIDYSSKWTVYACMVYFWARVAHLIVYTMGLPVFRTLAFTVGFLAQAVLALAIFKIL